MRNYLKIRLLILAFTAVGIIGLFGFNTNTTVSAQTPTACHKLSPESGAVPMECPPGTPSGTQIKNPTPTPTPAAPAGSDPAKAPIVVACPKNDKGEELKNKDGSCKIPTDCSAEEGTELNSGNCKILNRLLQIINVLSGLVATVVVAMIIIGGIQYSAAGGDPQKVAGAKKRIYNAVFAFIAYIFMYSFLQWIVPGGVLKK